MPLLNNHPKLPRGMISMQAGGFSVCASPACIRGQDALVGSTPLTHNLHMPCDSTNIQHRFRLVSLVLACTGANE